jgi:hypothetical protein
MNLRQFDLRGRDLSPRDRRLVAIMLTVVVVLVLLRSGLERGAPTGEAVRWADYPADLRPRIERLVSTSDCAGLRSERVAAERANRSTFERSGHDNARLIGYITDQMTSIRC